MTRRYEVHSRSQDGPWRLESNFPEQQRSAALDYAHRLLTQPGIQAVKVVEDRYDEASGRFFDRTILTETRPTPQTPTTANPPRKPESASGPKPRTGAGPARASTSDKVSSRQPPPVSTPSPAPRRAPSASSASSASSALSAPSASSASSAPSASAGSASASGSLGSLGSAARGAAPAPKRGGRGALLRWGGMGVLIGLAGMAGSVLVLAGGGLGAEMTAALKALLPPWDPSLLQGLMWGAGGGVLTVSLGALLWLLRRGEAPAAPRPDRPAPSAKARPTPEVAPLPVPAAGPATADTAEASPPGKAQGEPEEPEKQAGTAPSDTLYAPDAGPDPASDKTKTPNAAPPDTPQAPQPPRQAPERLSHRRPGGPKQTPPSKATKNKKGPARESDIPQEDLSAMTAASSDPSRPASLRREAPAPPPPPHPQPGRGQEIRPDSPDLAWLFPEPPRLFSNLGAFLARLGAAPVAAPATVPKAGGESKQDPLAAPEGRASASASALENETPPPEEAPSPAAQTDPAEALLAAVDAFVQASLVALSDPGDGVPAVPLASPPNATGPAGDPGDSQAAYGLFGCHLYLAGAVSSWAEAAGMAAEAVEPLIAACCHHLATAPDRCAWFAAHFRPYLDTPKHARMAEQGAKAAALWRQGQRQGIDKLLAIALSEWMQAEQAPRLRIAILFSRVIEAPDLAEQEGETALRRLMALHDRLLRQAVSECQGSIVKPRDYGFMAVFSAPQQAARCACMVQHRLQAHIAHHPADRCSFALGLTTGEALPEGGDWFGVPVNLAARLCDQAEGAHILTDETLPALLAETGTHFEPLGAWPIKGFPEPVPVFSLVWELEL